MPSIVSDDVELLVVMEQLARIVYTQNGNQHTDVSALLERAKQISIKFRSGAPDENGGVLNHLNTEPPIAIYSTGRGGFMGWRNNVPSKEK